MASIDEVAAAIGAAADSVETVAAATGSAKSTTDELVGQLAALGVEGKAAQAGALGERLQSEAIPLAQQLKTLLEEIRGQAEGLRGDGLQGAPSVRGSSPPSSSAPPATAASSSGGSESPPLAPKVIDGRLYSIHAQERMLDPTRNVSAPEIERALAGGKSRPGQNPGTTDYYDVEAKIHAVVNDKGDVVTVRRQSRPPGWAK